MHKILVVEDTLNLREEICDILSMEGYSVFQAENGKIGFEMALKEHPDLIVSDILMPVLSGFKMYEKLQKEPKTMHIPLIFLSAKAEKKHIRTGMNLGAEDYLTKPISTNDLVNAIKNKIKKKISRNQKNINIQRELQDKFGKEKFVIENKFKNLFDKSPVSIWEQDFSETIALLNKKKAETGDIETYLNENPEFVKKCVSKIKIISVNSKTLDLIGVKNLEELISHIRKTNTEQATNELKNELISIASGKKDYIGETEFVKTDNTILYTLVKSTMIDDTGKNIASVIDITESKQARKLLKESEENYRKLLEKIPDGVYQSTNEGKFVKVNSAMVKMLGYNSKEELLAINIKTDLYVKDSDRDSLSLNGLNQELGVYQVRKKDGSAIWVEDHGWYSFDKLGKTKLHQGIMRDVTDRIKKEEQFRLVVEAVPNAIILVNSKGEITLINKQAEIEFGYTPEELIGEKMEILIPSRYRKKHPERRDSYLINSEPRAMGAGRSLYALRKDETEFPAEIGLNPIEISQEPHVLASIINITERKEHQNKIKENITKLQQKNKELEQFSYITSHDLQEPLRTITSFSDILYDQYNDKLDDQAKKMFDFVKQATGRMSSLIKNLLDYSRIGHQEVLTTIDCNQLLKDISIDLNSLISKTNTVLKVNNLPIITAYPTGLRMLFQNLLTNAIKFSKKGVSPIIEINASKKKNAWEFSVQDNGVGIKKEFQSKIFAIFQRLHLKEEYEGTGIGLAHCKKIVSLHEGEIWVTSEQGEGSTFYFTIKKLKI